MAIREGRWDCTQCASRGIRGREMFCSGCGRKRPENTEFYLPDEEPEVTDENLLRRAQIGPDWYCLRCESSNQADQASCTQCGAEKGAAPSAPVRDYGLNESRKEAVFTPPTTSPYQPRPPQPRPLEEYLEEAVRPTSTNWLVVGATLLLIGLIAFTLWPRSVTLQVTGFSWHREIEIQKYATVVHEDWSIPSGGRELSRRQEVHHHDRVLDHYETRTRRVSERVQTGTERYKCGTRNKGNGFFEDKFCTRPVYTTRHRSEKHQEPVYRNDPVYKTWYRYEIDKWVPARVQQSNGRSKSDPAPSWPGFTLVDNGAGRIGNERESRRSEKYVVYFLSQDDKPTPYEHEVDRATWDAFGTHQLYTGKVSLGHLSNVQPVHVVTK